MSDRDALRRLGILAIVASCGEIGMSLPSAIAGMKILTAEQVMDGLKTLQRKGLVVRTTRHHPDGDRRYVHYRAADDLELLASNV
jgi:hypothetical protein